MAELSKLLAFMFKEDKEDILAQYNKMLDESDDEQALLESFGSPTKLAVTISRTYKRSERKLAVEADSKEDKPAETEHIFVTPVKKEKTAEVNTGLSYADIIEEIRREKAEEEGVEYKPMFFDEPEQPAAEETVQPEPETEEDGTQIASDEESTVVEPETEAPVSEETENEEKAMRRRRKRKLSRRKLTRPMKSLPKKLLRMKLRSSRRPRPIGRRRRRRLPKPGKNRPMLRLSRKTMRPNSCLKSLRA